MLFPPKYKNYFGGKVKYLLTLLFLIKNLVVKNLLMSPSFFNVISGKKEKNKKDRRRKREEVCLRIHIIL